MSAHSRREAELGDRARQLTHTLRTWPWFETLRTLRERFREDRLGLTAGSLTFTTLIALVPFVTVALAVFTAFPMFAGFESALESYFMQNLVPDSIARSVLQSLTLFAAKARGMGTLGLLLLVVTALATVLTMDHTLNAIWRVRKRRPIAQRLLIYWGALTLGPLALGVSLSLTSRALSASRGLVSALPGGVSLLLEVVQFLLLAGAAAGMFHFVPNTVVRWRHAWAGGLFVSAGFEVAKKGLAWYVASVPTYSMIYGAFATVPILLLWIYLSWVIVLLGAVIAAYAPSLQMRIKRIAPTPGWQFELALELIKRLEAARDDNDVRGLPLPVLAEEMRIDPLQIEPVLAVLVELDWVSRLDEAGEGRLVLLCDPARVALEPLVDRTLLSGGPATTAFRQRAQLPQMRLDDALGPAR